MRKLENDNFRVRYQNNQLSVAVDRHYFNTKVSIRRIDTVNLFEITVSETFGLHYKRMVVAFDNDNNLYFIRHHHAN